jgi:hypothetical protein
VSTQVADRFEKHLRDEKMQDIKNEVLQLLRKQSSNDPLERPSGSSPAVRATEAGRPAETGEISKTSRKGKAPYRRYPPDPSVCGSIKPRPFSSAPSAKKLVHWCIGGATAHVHNVCVEGTEGAKTGTIFIEELIGSYRKLRGMRRWFSLTDLANVKFIKV